MSPGGGTRTHSPSKQTAEDQRLCRRGPRDRQEVELVVKHVGLIY